MVAGSVRVYRSTLAGLVDDRRGGLGADRLLGWLDTPAGAAAVRAWYAASVDRVEPATAARYLSAVRAAVGWWRELGWLTSDPTAGLRRPPVPVDRTRALSRDQVGALLCCRARACASLGPLAGALRPAGGGCRLGASYLPVARCG